jgi:hypothetical protein
MAIIAIEETYEEITEIIKVSAAQQKQFQP